MDSQLRSHSKQAMATPRFKRIAPSSTTPCRPIAKVPRVSTSGYRNHVSLMSPARPCTPVIGTCDRFIPNRARTDVAKARRALLSENSANKQREPCGTPREYQQHLCQALWGTPSLDHKLMAFGTIPKPQGSHTRESFHSETRFRQDALRPVASQPVAMTPRKHRGEDNVSLERQFDLTAPNMLADSDLSIISYGPSLAVALDDYLYLRHDAGNSEVLTHQPGYTISCVSWSPDGKYIALGYEECIQIWTPREFHTAIFHNDGYVTAFAWKGMEILAAHDGVIMRYDLQEDEPVPMKKYQGHASHRITCLLWNDNSIASCGGGQINLWNTDEASHNIDTDIIPANRTMKHTGVRTLKFHPTRSDIIISGGDGGLLFWNSLSGGIIENCQCASIRDMVWSPFRNDEFLVAHENGLSLWRMNLVDKVMKIAEAKMDSDETNILPVSFGITGHACYSIEPNIKGQ